MAKRIRKCDGKAIIVNNKENGMRDWCLTDYSIGCELSGTWAYANDFDEALRIAATHYPHM